MRAKQGMSMPSGGWGRQGHEDPHHARDAGEGPCTFSGDTTCTLKMPMKTTQQGKPTRMTLDGQGKGLSAGCGTVKPLK